MEFVCEGVSFEDVLVRDCGVVTAICSRLVERSMGCRSVTRCVLNLYGGFGVDFDDCLSLTYKAYGMNSCVKGGFGRGCFISLSSSVLVRTSGGLERYQVGKGVIYRSVDSLGLGGAFSLVAYILSSAGCILSRGSLAGCFEKICGRLGSSKLFIFSVGSCCGVSRVLKGGVCDCGDRSVFCIQRGVFRSRVMRVGLDFFVGRRGNLCGEFSRIRRRENCGSRFVRRVLEGVKFGFMRGFSKCSGLGTAGGDREVACVIEG